MYTGLFNLIVIGLVAVMIGAIVMVSMVYMELGPTARLAQKRRKLVAVALGSGILAFIIKLLIILTIANFPQYTINPFLTAPVVAERPPYDPGKPGPAQYVWIDLPDNSDTLALVPNASRSFYVWKSLPDRASSPAYNPSTKAKIALGKQLFFDKNLSRDGTLSCASCHDLYGSAGGDGRSTALGIDQQIGPRNAPTVWNTAFQTLFFWDGRAASLEEQATGPMLNPVEMGMPSSDAVVKRVREQKRYQKAFFDAFGAGASITIDRIAMAIAAFERTLITSDTPYDRFVRGDIKALNPAQLRGMALFQAVGCITCHHGPNFSAASVFDDSMPRRIFPANPIPQEISYNLLLEQNTSTGTNRGVWRVPSLRNVALTGPWLHNGAVDKLEEVVRIMAAAQLGRAGHYLLWSDHESTMSENNQPRLTDSEVSDIVAFLNALSSDSLLAKMKQR
jgi:cytochrome c peroxidase